MKHPVCDTCYFRNIVTKRCKTLHVYVDNQFYCRDHSEAIKPIYRPLESFGIKIVRNEVNK